MNYTSDQQASSRAPTPSRGKHRRRRRLLILAVVLVALIILFRLVLDPIAAWATRRTLNNLDGIKGTFSSVHVGVIPPSYEINRFKLVVSERKDWNKPWVYVEHMRSVLDGRALLRGMLSLAIEVHEPKLRLPGGPASQPKKAAEPISEVLEKLPKLNVTRIQVFNAEIVGEIPPEVTEADNKEDEKKYKDKKDNGKAKGSSEPAEIWVHNVDASIENITTRKALAQGQPINFSMRGKIERTGTIKAFGTSDLFQKDLRFAGRFEMQDLQLARMFDIVAPRTDLQATKGTMDLFVELSAEDGHIAGGVKPLIKNLEVGAAKEGWTTALKAWLVDKGADLMSDRVAGREAIATTIPIRGNLKDPDVQIWPAVLGAVRNAFVSALASGYFNVPPDVSEKKEGPIKQAIDAVTDEGPPEAQPKSK